MNLNKKRCGFGSIVVKELLISCPHCFKHYVLKTVTVFKLGRIGYPEFRCYILRKFHPSFLILISWFSNYSTIIQPQLRFHIFRTVELRTSIPSVHLVSMFKNFKKMFYTKDDFQNPKFCVLNIFFSFLQRLKF